MLHHGKCGIYVHVIQEFRDYPRGQVEGENLKQVGYEGYIYIYIYHLFPATIYHIFEINGGNLCTTNPLTATNTLHEIQREVNYGKFLPDKIIHKHY